jgi:hypothetical protein
MPAAHANWTVDMLDALPDDGQRPASTVVRSWPVRLEFQTKATKH